MSKPRILIFSNWFSPGHKGGGSQTAAINLVRSLENEFEFRIVARDRDVGDQYPFPDIFTHKWMNNGGAFIRYLPPEKLRLDVIKSIVDETPHDLIHLNSVVSLPFAAYPLIARRFDRHGDTPLLISPHGELAPAALAKKYIRKSLYLSVGRAFGMLTDVTWHAITPSEAGDIRRTQGQKAKVAIAGVIPPKYSLSENFPPRSPKIRGSLKTVFFGRIDRMKNLDLVISLMARTPGATLDICGPVGQPDYWAECLDQIKSSGQGNTCRYVGSISPTKVGQTLSQYDLLFLPSQSESFGYAILDALAAGCPALISDRTPWKAEDSHGSIRAVPLENLELFHAELKNFLNLDESEHRLLRASARSYANRFVTNSSARVDMRAIYNDLIARVL